MPIGFWWLYYPRQIHNSPRSPLLTVYLISLRPGQNGSYTADDILYALIYTRENVCILIKMLSKEANR